MLNMRQGFVSSIKFPRFRPTGYEHQANDESILGDALGISLK